MTPEARGVFRELLDALWGESDCSLPKDDEVLSALAGVTREYWLTVRAQVLAWFDEANDRLTNPRALYEWKKARGYRSAKRKAGRQGGKAKAANKMQAQQNSSTASTLLLAKASPPSPSSVIRQPSSVGTEEPAYVPPIEVRTETAIRAGTAALESKLLRAVGRLSERTHRDAMALMREVTSYKRTDGTVVPGRANPSGLSPERLEKSLEDAEGWLADLDAGKAVAK